MTIKISVLRLNVSQLCEEVSANAQSLVHRPAIDVRARKRTHKQAQIKGMQPNVGQVVVYRTAVHIHIFIFFSSLQYFLSSSCSALLFSTFLFSSRCRSYWICSPWWSASHSPVWHIIVVAFVCLLILQSHHYSVVCVSVFGHRWTINGLTPCQCSSSSACSVLFTWLAPLPIKKKAIEQLLRMLK